MRQRLPKTRKGQFALAGSLALAVMAVVGVGALYRRRNHNNNHSTEEA